MNASNKLLFQLLKEAVADSFLQDNVAPKRVSLWKGEEIVSFQEDLFQKTKGRVSEKWFYSYFKKEPEKLPRIDMLNLLSAYAGYKNWNDFVAAHPEAEAIAETGPKRNNYLWLLLLAVPMILALYYFTDKENEFRFCMLDEDRNEPITQAVDIKILTDDESPIYLKSDSNGCFSYSTSETTIRFVVQSPYHKTDTIYRNIESNENTFIKLATDDYALMLRYYSNGNVRDLNKRKLQLEDLIADGAEIYQIFPGHSGIELYSKTEFINKLTVPTGSLKNINILQKKYEKGKIIKLKFIIR